MDESRAFLGTYVVKTTGNPAVPPKRADAVTVEKAIKLFLESKQGEDLSHNTIVKHKVTLSRLQEYYDGEGISLLADVTLPVLTSWRAGWTYKAPIAKRNNPERVRAFLPPLYRRRTNFEESRRKALENTSQRQ